MICKNKPEIPENDQTKQINQLFEQKNLDELKKRENLYADQMNEFNQKIVQYTNRKYSLSQEDPDRAVLDNLIQRDTNSHTEMESELLLTRHYMNVLDKGNLESELQKLKNQKLSYPTSKVVAGVIAPTAFVGYNLFKYWDRLTRLFS